MNQPTPTPRPWLIDHRESGVGRRRRIIVPATNHGIDPIWHYVCEANDQDAALIVSSVNLREPLEAVAEAAAQLLGEVASFYALAGGLTTAEKVRLKDLVAALAALDEARKQESS